MSKKPYIEKPEKGEDEPDEVAAKKAWDLHLQRDNSQVLEYFMGQIKSKVQCCKEGCGRVSTTFDPFMFLSVPIPGSNERRMRVSFVPAGVSQRSKTLHITVNKTDPIKKLVEKAAEQMIKAEHVAVDGKPYVLENLIVCDIWNHELYSWLDMDKTVDTIRDTDVTYIYEVIPKSMIKKMEEDQKGNSPTTEDETEILEKLEENHRPHRYRLDPPSQMHINGEGWKSAIEGYIRTPKTQLMKILNSRRGTNSERLKLYQSMDEFVISCLRELDKESNKRARVDDSDDGNEDPENQHDNSQPTPMEHTITADTEITMCSPSEPEVPALVELSESSTAFVSVKRRHDVALLDACATKLRRMIIESIEEKHFKKNNEGGYLVQVHLRRCSSLSGSSSSFTSHSHQHTPIGNPFVVRAPSNMTVYAFREEMAKKLTRSLRLGQPVQQEEGSNFDGNGGQEETQGSDVIPMEGDSDQGDEERVSGAGAGVESLTVSSEALSNVPESALTILRQIPLTGRRKSMYNSKLPAKVFGSLDVNSSHDQESRPTKLASPTDEEELRMLADVVGNLGLVNLDWPADLCERVLDEKEYTFLEELKDPDEEEALAARNSTQRVTTILDCVAKYCQKEQLEETEMWYCNRCKEHVRAWKQYHLYRAPPILIIHLKRFQYTASTHRRDKISTFIDFPLTGLDLSDHVMHWEEGEEPEYDCYAVRCVSSFFRLTMIEVVLFVSFTHTIWCLRI